MSKTSMVISTGVLPISWLTMKVVVVRVGFSVVSIQMLSAISPPTTLKLSVTCDVLFCMSLALNCSLCLPGESVGMLNITVPAVYEPKSNVKWSFRL